MESRRAILGVVDSHEKAGEIVAYLRLNGFPTSLLSLVFVDRTRLCAAGREIDMARACRSFGGAVGFFMNITALAIPGLGAAVAGGVMVPELKEDPKGLVGGLTRLGISVLEARQCERDLRAGNILLALHVEHPEARAYLQAVLENHGAATVGGTEARYETAA